MWHALQITVIFLVVLSNAHWRYTDNHMVPFVLGVIAASAATRIVMLWIDLVAKVRQFQGRRTQVNRAIGDLPVGIVETSSTQYPRQFRGR